LALKGKEVTVSGGYYLIVDEQLQFLFILMSSVDRRLQTKKIKKRIFVFFGLALVLVFFVFLSDYSDAARISHPAFQTISSQPPAVSS